MNGELLIMFAIDCDRAYLYAHPERELTADETQRYDEALARRATGVPAQYITGHQEFWGLDLIVSPVMLRGGRAGAPGVPPARWAEGSGNLCRFIWSRP